MGRDETIANGLFGMAMYHYRQGDTDSAETLFRHSIVLQEEKLWPYHPLVPKTLLKLGDFYDSQQLPDKAELCYRSALEKQLSVFSDNHPSLLDALTRLARFYARAGNDEKAKDFARQIIQLEDS
jgi:TolA-binding protein